MSIFQFLQFTVQKFIRGSRSLNRNVIGVATDTASTDYGQSTDFETHQILGGANIWAIENLANAEALPETGRI